MNHRGLGHLHHARGAAGPEARLDLGISLWPRLSWIQEALCCKAPTPLLGPSRERIPLAGGGQEVSMGLDPPPLVGAGGPMRCLLAPHARLESARLERARLVDGRHRPPARSRHFIVAEALLDLGTILARTGPG